MFISFIVPTYNCVDRVPVLLRTVQALQGLPCEFLISDGGSTDGTVELLAAATGVRVVCSASDRGIYDAWNRALGDCSGQYISFIGVDDEPCRRFIECALGRFGTAEAGPGLIYGDILLKRGKLFRHRSAPGRPALFYADAPTFDISHPGCLNHAALFRERRFSADYKLAGDLEFYLRARLDISQRGYVRLNELQAVVDADGLSRSVSAFGTYRDEYSRIQSTLHVRLGYSLPRLQMMSLLNYAPWVFKVLKQINWALLGRSRVSS